MPSLFKFLDDFPELKLDKSKKKVVLIYTLSLTGVLIIYFFLFLKPTIAQLLYLIPRVHEEKAEIKTLNNDLRFEDTFKMKLAVLQEKMGRYEKRLSREKELPMLIGNISKMARDSHVKILGITPITKIPSGPEAEKKEALYQELPIAINAQSGYHNAGAFINKLENDQRYVEISNIKIKSNRDNPKRHDVEFVLYAYTFKASE